MDKVAIIEQNKVDDEGRRVESSFHPLSWQHDKTIMLQKRTTKRRSNSGKNSRSLRNGKGKQIEKASDTSSEEEARARFYPYHYFDWIAGTSTGG
jgi:hypothetical protein